MMLDPRRVALLIPLTLPATAQDVSQSSGETVVTARRVEELVGEVPGSVSVLDERKLRDTGATTVRDASVVVPNLLMTEFNSRRLSFPFLRGIGSGQGEPAVATYVDGVPQLSSGSTNLPLFGLDRVEFLRGPQGTLYGRNSLGGVIHLISKPPGDEFESSAFAGGGDYGLGEAGFSYSGPIDPGELSFGLSGVFSTREGYTTNIFDGEDVDSKEAFFGRAQALWTPNANNEVRLDMHGETSRDGGFALGFLSDFETTPHEINQDFTGVTERDLLAPSLTWNRLGNSVDFVSITSFQTWDVLETSDFDFMPIDGVVRTTTEEQDYFYQEFRLSSADQSVLSLTDNTTLSWLTGVSLYQSDSARSAANDLSPLVTPFPGVDTNTGDFDDSGLGVFGQGTLTLHEDFDLTAGVRFDAESREADLRHINPSLGIDDSNSFDDDFSEVVPHFSAAYRPAESSTVYASVSKGYKSGGFNLSAPTGSFGFENEESLAYEVGYKQSFLQGNAHFNLAGFYIDWQDMQLSLFDPAAGGYVDNVGESESTGAELDVDVKVLDHVTLFGAFGITDTEFQEYVDPYGVNVAGNDLPFAPDSTFSFAAQVDGALGQDSRWYVRGEYVMIGDFFYDAGNLGEESYELANFRAGVERGPLRLDAWLRNAFDEEYVPVAFQPDPGDPTTFVGEMGAPVTWGVTLRGSF